MDLVQLLSQIEANKLTQRFLDNPAAQFGIRPEQFLGASILPERTVDGNRVEDEEARYRPVIANDAGRYSPVQIKEGAALFTQFEAVLAESDLGKEYTGKQYDDLRKLVNRGGDFEAQGRLLGWLDRDVNQGLLRLNEKQRWQAIVDAQVDRLGDNSYSETVTYPNPVNNRRQIAADWEAVSSGVSTNDPFTDIFGIFEDARDKNVIFTRIIMSTKTQFKMLRNTKVQDRSQFGQAGFIPPNASVIRGPMAVPRLAALFQAEGLPSPEIFDGVYEDDSGSHRYLPENKIVFLGTTGRSVEILPQEGDPFFLDDVLGYHAIGTPQGEDNPGRVMTNRAFTDDKPYRIESKGWQTALPIVLDGDKIFVLDTEAP